MSDPGPIQQPHSPSPGLLHPRTTCHTLKPDPASSGCLRLNAPYASPHHPLRAHGSPQAPSRALPDAATLDAPCYPMGQRNEDSRAISGTWW